MGEAAQISKHPDYEWKWPLNKSKWWTAAVAMLSTKPIDRIDKDNKLNLASCMLAAACHANQWPTDSQAIVDLAKSLRGHTDLLTTKSHVMMMAAHEPPTISELRLLGVPVEDEDYQQSMPIYTKIISINRTTSKEIIERYNKIPCLDKYGWSTSPRVLNKYAKELGFNSYYITIINIISNTRKGTPINQKTIAEQALCSLNTVKRVVSDLRERGLLSITRGSGFHDANIYDCSPLWQKLAEIDVQRSTPQNA